MKNKIIIFLIGLFLLPISVNAKNRIYNIDMRINVTQDGSANITETWDGMLMGMMVLNGIKF